MKKRPFTASEAAVSRPGAAQRGAALLAAMLTVALVATLAAAAMWQQWRGVEVEAAERARVQSAWLLGGALDWGRLILRVDDDRQADHLGEPWAVPLAEARISTFLTAGAEVYGISRDSLKSHANFRQKLELPFALVSDPDEALCTLFDVIRLKNMYGKQVRGIERSTFLINRAGVLVKEWRKVKVPGHVAEVLAAVRELHDSPSHAF